MAHDKAWRHRQRARLIEELGGICVHCGATERLEFDHIDPADKTWITRDLYANQRMLRYIREAAEGKIQLLCKRCNQVKWCKTLTAVSSEPF